MLKRNFHRERGSKLLRAIDRYIGIPLIVVLRFFKKRRSLPQYIERIALFKSAAIGDTVCLLASIQEIQHSYPNAAITLYVGHSNYAFAKLIEGVEVIALPMTNPLKAIHIIRQKSFDIWIDNGSWPRIDALLSFFSRSKYTIGFNTYRQRRHFLYDHAINRDKRNHEYIDQMRLLHPLGIYGTAKPFFPDRFITDLKQDARSNYIVFHLFPGGSRAYLKEWPIQSWLNLANKLIQRGFDIYLTGSGLLQKMRAISLKEQCTRSEKVFVVVEAYSLQQTMQLLVNAKAVVSVDTGIVHIASALKANIVALFGPTDPIRYGPICSSAFVIKKDPKHCCIDLGFEAHCKTNTCMQKITPEEVFTILSQQMLHVASN